MFLIHLEREKIQNLFEQDKIEEDASTEKMLSQFSTIKNQAQIIKQGPSFETFIQRINYQMLLSSDDRHEVSNFAEKFETDVNRFEVQFEKEFKVD